MRRHVYGGEGEGETDEDMDVEWRGEGDGDVCGGEGIGEKGKRRKGEREGASGVIKNSVILPAARWSRSPLTQPKLLSRPGEVTAKYTVNLRRGRWDRQRCHLQ